VSRNLLLVFACLFGLLVVNTMVQVALPLHAVSQGIAPSSVGVLIAITLGVGLVLDVPVSALSDAVGRRVPIMVGGALLAVGPVVLARSVTFGGLAAGAACAAAGASLVMWPALAFVSELATPPELNRVQGINGAVQRSGLVFATVVLVFLLAKEGGIITGFLIASSAGVVIVIAAGAIREPMWKKSALTVALAPRSYVLAGRLVARSRLVLMGSAMVLITTSTVLVVGNSFFPLYFVDGLGQPSALAAAMLSWRNLLAALVSLQFGRIARRFELLPIILVANAAAVASVVLMLVGSAALFLFFLLTLQGLAYGFSVATSNLLAIAGTAREERALGFATQQVMGRLGAVLLPLLLGWTLETGGWRAMLVMASVAVSLFLLLLVATSRRMRTAVARANVT
jgi:MFS family permease